MVGNGIEAPNDAAMTKVVVTGANGFVGRALCKSLVGAGYSTIGTVRTHGRVDASTRCAYAITGDIDRTTNWFSCLNAADAVVHLAAQMQDIHASDSEPLAELRRVNVEGTENLAWQAAASGVKRFVYVSSVKVHGEQMSGRPVTVDDAPSPTDPYAISKLEAERVLRHVAAETGLQVTLVRPPLIYGPGVQGNFLRLIQWIDKGLPLPLANVDNRRSLIALDNLVDFLVLCIHHPAAVGQTFLISDGEDLSTPELMRRIADAMGRPLRLWPMPPTLLRLIAGAIGKRHWFDKLCGSLQIDASRAREVLGWRPPAPMDQALSLTVAWHRGEKGIPLVYDR
jgi:nucleoside-diphosphate-sugar epimerase